MSKHDDERLRFWLDWVRAERDRKPDSDAGRLVEQALLSLIAQEVRKSRRFLLI